MAKKSSLIIFLPFKHPFISSSSMVSKVIPSPLFILFYCFLAFSYNFTSCFPHNPSPSASVLNVKILQWLKRKPRICCSPIAQSTAFSILVINLFVLLFSLHKIHCGKNSSTSQNRKTKNCFGTTKYTYCILEISKSLKIKLSLIPISIFSIVLP